MKLLVGLGNPGNKYKNNRHNAGYYFVDFLLNKLTSYELTSLNLKLLKTDCYADIRQNKNDNAGQLLGS